MKIETKLDVANYLLTNFANNPLCSSIADKLNKGEKLSIAEKNSLKNFLEGCTRKFHELVWEHERYGKVSEVNSEAARDLRKVDATSTYRKILELIGSES